MSTKGEDGAGPADRGDAQEKDGRQERPVRRGGPLREGSGGVVAFPGRAGQSPRTFKGPERSERSERQEQQEQQERPLGTSRPPSIVAGLDVPAGSEDEPSEEDLEAAEGDPGAFWDENAVASALLDAVGEAFEDCSGVEEVFFDIDDVSCLPAVLFDVSEDVPEASTVKALAAALARAARRDVVWLGSSRRAVDFVLAADPDDPGFNRTRFVEEELADLPPPMATAEGAEIVVLRPKP